MVAVGAYRNSMTVRQTDVRPTTSWKRRVSAAIAAAG